MNKTEYRCSRAMRRSLPEGSWSLFLLHPLGMIPPLVIDLHIPLQGNVTYFSTDVYSKADLA